MLRVVIDVEDVLADVVGKVAAIAEVGRRQITEPYPYSSLDLTQRQAVFQSMARADFWAALEPMPRARDGVDVLLLAGYDVIFAARPDYGCGEFAAAVTWWLGEYFPRVHRSHYAFLARTELLSSAHYLISARVDMLTAWRQQALLYAATYNQASFNWGKLVTDPNINHHL
jgi:5'(3')-deoxyribonucleotidase